MYTTLISQDTEHGHDSYCIPQDIVLKDEEY